VRGNSSSPNSLDYSWRFLFILLSLK